MEFSPDAKRHARLADSLDLPLVSSTVTREVNLREPAHVRGAELKLFAHAVAADGKMRSSQQFVMMRTVFFIHRGAVKSTGRQK